MRCASCSCNISGIGEDKKGCVPHCPWSGAQDTEPPTPWTTTLLQGKGVTANHAMYLFKSKTTETLKKLLFPTIHPFWTASIWKLTPQFYSYGIGEKEITQSYLTIRGQGSIILPCVQKRRTRDIAKSYW